MCLQVYARAADPSRTTAPNVHAVDTSTKLTASTDPGVLPLGTLHDINQTPASAHSRRLIPLASFHGINQTTASADSRRPPIGIIPLHKSSHRVPRARQADWAAATQSVYACPSIHASSKRGTGNAFIAMRARPLHAAARHLRTCGRVACGARPHLRRHEHDVDVAAEVDAVVLHHAQQEAVRQPERRAGLQGRQNSRVQIGLGARGATENPEP
jgi:hypothetical protein